MTALGSEESNFTREILTSSSLPNSSRSSSRGAFDPVIQFNKKDLKRDRDAIPSVLSPTLFKEEIRNRVEDKPTTKERTRKRDIEK